MGYVVSPHFDNQHANLVLFAGSQPETLARAALAALPDSPRYVIAVPDVKLNAMPTSAASVVIEEIRRNGLETQLLTPLGSIPSAWLRAAGAHWKSVAVSPNAQ